MEELTLKSFEEAAEKVKEATLPTNLVYSEYFSSQTGNRVYLKPENMQYTGAYITRLVQCQRKQDRKGLLQLLQEIMHRVLHLQLRNMGLRRQWLCLQRHRLSR